MLGTIRGEGRYCRQCRATVMRIWATQHSPINGDGSTGFDAPPKRSHKRKPKTRRWWDGDRWVDVVVDARDK